MGVPGVRAHAGRSGLCPRSLASGLEPLRPPLFGAGEDGPQAELDRLDYEASRTYRLLALAGAGLFVATSLILLVLQVGFVRYSLLQPVTSSVPTPLGPSTLAHETPIHALGQILSGHKGMCG